jgi:hypothetical protein
MVEPVNLDDYRGEPSFSGPLETRGGGGDSTGMDPWQQTVETRLGELRTDLRGIGTDLGKVKTDVATLTERVGNLPTKGFIVTATLTTLAIIAAFALFGPNLRALFGLH